MLGLSARYKRLRLRRITVQDVVLVVPFSPGGASDIMARAIGQKLSEIWKQPVIIDNRPGGSTTTGTAYAARNGGRIHPAARAAAVHHHAACLFESALQGAEGFPGGLGNRLLSPRHGGEPVAAVNNLKELFDMRAPSPASPMRRSGPAPRRISCRNTWPARRSSTWCTCRIAAAARCRRSHQRTNSFYSGPTTEALPQFAPARSAHRGAVREEIKQLPDLPTSAEQGYGKYNGTSWSSIVVSAGTPRRSSKRSARTLQPCQRSGFRAKLEEQGAEFLGATPAQAQPFLVSEDKLWRPLVKASGVKPEN